MKIVALGDTHGRQDWEKIVAKETFDKIVFIGDYFDTHEGIPAPEQITNFKNIIDYKEQEKDRVILLIGNHDYHYLKTSINEKYSGYQDFFEIDIQEQLHKALDKGLMQMCYTIDNLLFTHAGVTKTWCNNYDINLGNLQGDINKLFIEKPNSFRFQAGERYSNYGDDITQSPIWVRPFSLLEDMVDNYIQIVGHTTQKKIILSDAIIGIDTLGTSGEYLVYEDKELSVAKF